MSETIGSKIKQAQDSLLAKIKQLEEERAKLMDEAKATALATAQTAVAELNELGFHYRLTEDNEAPKQKATRQTTPGTRRTGIRDEVLAAINAAGADGITRQNLLTQLEVTSKSDEQAISNAVSALKKAGTISGEKGVYRGA